MALDYCKGEPPCRLDEYIRHGNEVGLLDLEIILGIQAWERHKAVVRVSDGSCRVATCIGGCPVRWKYWKNNPKWYEIDI